MRERWTVVLCVAVLGGAWAARPAAGAEQLLDMEALLERPEILSQNIGDRVWVYHVRKGRRLVQVPVRVVNVSQPVELDRPSVDLRLGRFVAWRIPQPKNADSRPKTRPHRENEKQPPRLGDRELLAEMSGGQARVREDDPIRKGIDKLGDAVDATDAVIEGAPDDAPRVARSVRVLPNGVMYPLERAIPGAEVGKGTSVFHLNLRRGRLAEQQPKRGERPERRPNEPVQEFRKRVIAYREGILQDLEDFKKLREAVMALPDEITAKRPEVFLCVFEMPAVIDELTLQNVRVPEADNAKAVGSWTIPISVLNELRKLYSGKGGARRGGGLSEDQTATVEHLLAWTEDRHPLSLRASAMAVKSAGWLWMAQPNDPLYELLSRILQGPDGEARSEIVTGLVAMVPPTSASAKLLRSSASNLSPQLRLQTLKNLFTTEKQGVASEREMIATANDVLADPSSPPADEVVLQMVRTAQGKPGTIAGLVDGVRFAVLPEPRRSEAIRAVVRLAGAYDLAAKMVDQRLLKGEDAEVLERALKELAELKVDHGRGATRPGEKVERASQPLAEGRASAPIPIESEEHNLFALLVSDRDAIRRQAFAALESFRFSPREEEAASTMSDPRYRRLLEAVFENQPAPPSAAKFLGRQPEAQKAAASLVELVLHAGEPSAGYAARALLELGRDVTPLLRQMRSEERRRLASRLYLEQDGQVTPIVGLLQAPGATRHLVPWFGKRMSDGELPPPAQWAEIYRGVEDLLQLVAEGEEVTARAAATALITAVGGDVEEVDALVARLDGVEPNATAELRERWASFRAEMLRRTLQRAAGEYRLGLVVEERGGARRIELGNITLVESDTGLAVANDAFPIRPNTGTLGFEIDPVELKNLRAQALEELPLERVTQPVQLRPTDEGGWVGYVSLPDGRRGTLAFEPVGE